jgi:hypothetical protein
MNTDSQFLGFRKIKTFMYNIKTSKTLTKSVAFPETKETNATEMIEMREQEQSNDDFNHFICIRLFCFRESDSFHQTSGYCDIIHKTSYNNLMIILNNKTEIVCQKLDGIRMRKILSI